MAEAVEVRSDGQVSAEHRERAARRARGRLRRYAVANGLQRLLTLTYRPPQPTDPAVVLRDCQAFQRRLAEAYPAVVWVRVFERHRSGALHVHFICGRGLPDRATERRSRILARMWGRGFVDLGERLGQPGSGARERARSGARYAAKYVGKGSVAGFGRHSYEVRQGFQPAAVRLRAWDPDSVRRQAIVAAGGEVPEYEWSSSSAIDWRGPPVTFMAWA